MCFQNLGRGWERQVKRRYLNNFNTLSPTAFAELMAQDGFQQAACYLWREETLVRILVTDAVVGSEDAEADGNKGSQGERLGFPPAARCKAYEDYTTQWPKEAKSAERSLPTDGEGLGTFRPVPWGWTTAWDLGLDPEVWPKGAAFYCPDQLLVTQRLVVVVLGSAPDRATPVSVEGMLEAMAGRVRLWLMRQEARKAVTDGGLGQHVARLGLDLERVIDHELRTPLAALVGYSSLLVDALGPLATAEVREFARAVDQQAALATEAVNKVSLAMTALNGVGQSQAPAPAPVDLGTTVARVGARLKASQAERFPGEVAPHLDLQVEAPQTLPVWILGDQEQVACALWEVVKNAAAHTGSGLVRLRVLVAAGRAVVEIEDDGPGVAPGAEEMIFLRFYQEPIQDPRRASNRGLGLGLFLARHIAERHGGQLVFVREKNISLFRFVWPLLDADQQDRRQGA